MPQKVAREVGLNQSQIFTILNSEKGYPTFAQRSGGRFRCNQVPELGLLKPRHLSSIRAQVGTNHNAGVTSVEKVHLLAVHIDRFGDVRCPGCAHWKMDTSPNNIETCNWCNMQFRVII